MAQRLSEQNEFSVLLGSDAASLDNMYPTFRDSVRVSSLRLEKSKNKLDFAT